MRASIAGFALALLLTAWVVVADTPTTAPVLSGKLADPVELIRPDLGGWVWVERNTSSTQPGKKIDDVWSIKDGLLVSKGKPIGYIRTEKSFGPNWVLTVEQRHVTKGNGGILIGIAGDDKVWPHCIEVQGASGTIGDLWNQGHLKMTVDPSRKDPKDKTDRHILRIGPNSEKPVGEWNTIEVTSDHSNLVVKVNGQIQNIATNVDDLSGHIGIQAEGAPMEFRKIEIREIK